MHDSKAPPKAKRQTNGLFGWMKSLLVNHNGPMNKLRRVHVIINPAAGKDQPVLRVINSVFQTAGVDWQVFVTKEVGDAGRLAKEAVRGRVDLVVVNGGDGTLAEVAGSLLGSDIPLAIIPGGTANILALSLGIPMNPTEACALAVNPNAAIRLLDMGQVGEDHFLLRAGTGFNAAMIEGTDHEKKERLGVFAYGLAGLQALSDPPVARYHLVLDGMEVESEGLACVIANSGTMGINGMPALSLAPDIDMNDGLLDVLMVTRADLPAIVSLVANVLTGAENLQAMQHWKAREITVTADPPQTLQGDGEILGQTPVTIRVLPSAIRVIVPPAVQQ